MEIHQALTRSPTIKNYLCRHEQVRMEIGNSCVLLPCSVWLVEL